MAGIPDVREEGAMRLDELHRRAIESWQTRLDAVGEDQWSTATPCVEWDVRTLVNHVVAEELWTAPLVAGSTIAAVGDRFDGDVLGDDAAAVARSAADAAATAVAERLPKGGLVSLSFGDVPVEEYVYQLTADHLIHGWDLAVATGQSRALDPEMVEEVATWFAGREAMYRDGGAIGPRVEAAGNAQEQLLAGFGRDPSWPDGHDTNEQVLARFSTAFGAGDVTTIMQLMTDDVVFEATGPAPDGTPHRGAEPVRAVWEELFGGTPGARFTEEESFVSGDRGVLRWRFDWDDGGDGPGHVRGVDLLRFRDGKVAEKLSYVKG